MRLVTAVVQLLRSRVGAGVGAPIFSFGAGMTTFGSIGKIALTLDYNAAGEEVFWQGLDYGVNAGLKKLPAYKIMPTQGREVLEQNVSLKISGLRKIIEYKNQ